MRNKHKRHGIIYEGWKGKRIEMQEKRGRNMEENGENECPNTNFSTIINLIDDKCVNPIHRGTKCIW